MVRKAGCPKEEINRGAWRSHEDKLLSDYIMAHGPGRWQSLPKNAGLKRCGKSCRMRWLNYLRPDIKRGNITDEEEELIIRLHKLLGNRWSLIAGRLPGRTDNEIKNYWNTCLRKKFSSDCMEPYERSKSKKSYKKPSTEKTVSVIRTKAARCKGYVHPDQLLKPMDSPLNNLLSVDPMDADFHLDFNVHEETPPFTMDHNEFCMAESIDNSPLQHVSDIHFYRNSDCLSGDDGIFTSLGKENYLTGIHHGEIEEEHLPPFFDPETWDPFVLQKI